jgi:hypothetical protein
MIDLFFFWEGRGIISYSCCYPEIEIKKKN